MSNVIPVSDRPINIPKAVGLHYLILLESKAESVRDKKQKQLYCFSTGRSGSLCSIKSDHAGGKPRHRASEIWRPIASNHH